MLTLARRSDTSLQVRVLMVAIAAAALLAIDARPAAAATVLYVDKNNPSCSDTGSGTSTQPYCSIAPAAKVATTGQTVQVASGTYNELVSVGKSGGAGAPVVYTAAPGATVTVGSGVANGFKVSTKSNVTIQGFTVSGTTSYGIYVTGGSNVTVSNNTVNNSGSHGIYVTGSSSNVTVSNNTVNNAGGTGIYVTSSSSNVTVSGNGVSGGASYGIYVNTLSGITVSGNTVSNTTSYGINVAGSSNITVSGNNVSGAGEHVSGSTKYGIKLADTSGSVVSGNVSHDNSEAGIFLDADTNGVQVTGNTTTGNARGYSRAAPGIDVRGYSNTIDRNVSHHNEDSGLQFYTGSHDNLVVDNLSYYNGDHGIDDLNAPNQRIIGNTVWWNYTAGINLEGTSTGGTVQNNVSVDNGYNVSPCITPPAGQDDCTDETRTRSNIRVDSNSTSGTTVDYNLTWLNNTSPPAVVYVWGSTKYTSLSAFRTTGQGAHDTYADPQFVSTGSNFHLTAGSPAIDSANSGVSGQTSTDLQGNGRVDVPGTPNSGTGPRTYDDRGAYEFQP